MMFAPPAIPPPRTPAVPRSGRLAAIDDSRRVTFVETTGSCPTPDRTEDRPRSAISTFFVRRCRLAVNALLVLPLKTGIESFIDFFD